MCSQGAFGGALRCPEYAKDLPRYELIEALKTQFIRRGFSIAVPADAYDETRWNRDEVAVFFQSGGSVKPRCTLLVEAGIRHPGDPPAAQAAAAAPAAAVASADEAARAADTSIPTVRLSLEGRMLRAELLKAQELPAAAAAASAAAAAAPAAAAAVHGPPANVAQAQRGTGGGDGGAACVSSTAKDVLDTMGGNDDEEDLMGWAGF